MPSNTQSGLQAGTGVADQQEVMTAMMAKTAAPTTTTTTPDVGAAGAPPLGLPRAASSSTAAAKNVRPGTPNFLMKLLQILEDPAGKGLCEWAEDGKSFFVHDPAEFSKKVLPSYFKHTNFLSFVRQLNMYHFNKIIETKTGLETQESRVQFASATFVRGRPDLLQAPRAKKRSAPVKQDTINEALANINEIRTKQAELERRLAAMHDRTEKVGSAVMAWRQQSQRNQSMISRIMTFLASMYQKNNLSSSSDVLALPNISVDGAALDTLIDENSSDAGAPSMIEEQNGSGPQLDAKTCGAPKRTRGKGEQAEDGDDLFRALAPQLQRRKLDDKQQPTDVGDVAEFEITDIGKVLESSISPTDTSSVLAALPSSRETEDMHTLARTISLGIEDLSWTLMENSESQDDMTIFNGTPDESLGTPAPAINVDLDVPDHE